MNQDADDLVPVMDLPANRPISISFHKDIDLETVELGQTFQVQRLEENGGNYDVVEDSIGGKMELHPRRITFWPNEPWEEGEIYRYVLHSGGYENQDANYGRRLNATDDFNCGDDAICSTDGLPLHTQPLGFYEVEEFQPLVPGMELYREEGVAKRAPDRDAGGPDFVQYFSGAEKTNSVLQFMAGMPQQDTNGDMLLQRDTHENFHDGRIVHHYDYDTQEAGPTDQLFDYENSELDLDFGLVDPAGVHPSSNSAKVLIAQREESYFHPDYDQQMISSAIGVGCGFQRTVAGDGGENWIDFSDPVPHECPKEKFTYFHTSLFAEVTNEVDQERGVKVLLWPSTIIGSSIDLSVLLSQGAGQDHEDEVADYSRGMTGPQIMRMRYADNNDDGNRTGPVEGWIRYSPEHDGPIMTATVDLYVDVPALVDHGGFGAQNGATNLNSYPVTMELEGAVEFLDDGRMVVSQYNLNPVVVPVDLSILGMIAILQDMVIPERAAALQYISQPVKR